MLMLSNHPMVNISKKKKQTEKSNILLITLPYADYFIIELSKRQPDYM